MLRRKLEDVSVSADGLALETVTTAAPPPLTRLAVGSALSTQAEFSEKVVATTLAIESSTRSPPPSTMAVLACEAGRA